MDKLRATEFLQHLSGKVYLSHYQAVTELAPDLCHLSEIQTQIIRRPI